VTNLISVGEVPARAGQDGGKKKAQVSMLYRRR